MGQGSAARHAPGRSVIGSRKGKGEGNGEDNGKGRVEL
jgi:hypothetical protein